MDFDSCFGECRKAHHSTSCQCQRFKSPIEIQGQGDCKCNADLQRTNQNLWPSSDKRKTLKIKLKEEIEGEPKPEGEKKFADPHFGYPSKRDSPGKFKQEKKDPEGFDGLNCSWNSPYSNWITKEDAVAPSEQPNRNQHSKSEDLTQKFFDFEKKVDFLYQIFKDGGQKPSTEYHGQQTLIKALGLMPGDVFHFLDLNYRMTTVEESIGKLASILEDLLKDPKKGKEQVFPEQSLLFSDPLNFDEMNVTQRMNYLKSKNDLFKSLFKAFFNAGSVDDICSRMSSLSNDYEFKQSSVNSNLDFGVKQHSKNNNLDEIIESLRKLRQQMTDSQPKKSQNYCEKTNCEKRDEHASKFFGDSRLEVISEQAELAFSEDIIDNAEDDFEEKGLLLNFKEKVSEAKEKSQANYSIHDVTARLSPQEAELLNSSLKKVRFEHFASLDSTGKKIFKTSIKDVPGKEEGKSQFKADDSTFLLYDEEIHNNSSDNSNTVFGKSPKNEGYNESTKAGRSSPEAPSNNLCKPMEAEEAKKAADQPECKSKSLRKIPQKNTFTLLPSFAKGRRSDCFAANDRSPTREACRKEPKEERQRPATEPRTPRKSLSPLGMKPPVPDRSKKNSGMNNVKNKNKNLLSKKPFV